jgi:hypothetical protein
MGAPRKKPWAKKQKVGVTIRADVLEIAQAQADEAGVSLSQHIENRLRADLVQVSRSSGVSASHRLSAPSPDLAMLNAPKKGKIKD